MRFEDPSDQLMRDLIQDLQVPKGSDSNIIEYPKHNYNKKQIDKFV